METAEQSAVPHRPRMRRTMELTTIYLKPGQKDRLREMAEREDITQAQLIRRGIEMVLREGIR